MMDSAVNDRFREIPAFIRPQPDADMSEYSVGVDFAFDNGGVVPSSSNLSGHVVSADQSSSATALSQIVAYIPTEILTTYVAILAALSTDTQSSLEKWVTFWIFLGFTPVASWVIFAAKVRTHTGTKSERRKAQKKLPWWEFFSATLAFAVWAYALPASPFSLLSWYKPALGTAGLLFVSFLLGMFAPLFKSTNS